MERIVKCSYLENAPKPSSFFDKLRLILKYEDNRALTNLFDEISSLNVEDDEKSSIKERLSEVYINAFLDDEQFKIIKKMVDSYISCYIDGKDNETTNFALATKALNFYFEIFKYIYMINSDDEQKIERRLYYDFATNIFKSKEGKKIFCLDIPCSVPEMVTYISTGKSSYVFDAILFIRKNAEYFLDWVKKSNLKDKDTLKNMYCFLFECKAYRKVKRYHMALEDGIRKNYIINADNNRHRIECMDCADRTGVETIRPMRLVEKICHYIEHFPKEDGDYNIAVIGNLDYENIYLDACYSSEILEMKYLLELMLKEKRIERKVKICWYVKNIKGNNTSKIMGFGEKVSVEIIGKQSTLIAKMLENATELKKLVNENDVLFLLDCYELYQSLEFEKRKDSLYGKEFFGDINKKYSDYFNEDIFTQSLQEKTYLERLMTQLNGVEINPFAYSGKIRRTFKKAVIDYLKKVVNDQNECKNVYVYFDNGKKINEVDYPEWLIMRLETYNDKLIQIAQISNQIHRRKLKFIPEDNKIFFDMHRMIKNLCLEYYYSIAQDDFRFRNNEGTDKLEKSVALIAYAFQNVRVCIDYANVNNIMIYYSIDHLNFDIIRSKFQDIAGESFDFEHFKEVVKKTTIEFLTWAFEVRRSDDYMLNNSFRNDFKTVLNNSSVSVNDMLFTEIYSDYTFEIISQIVESDDFDWDNNENNTMEYSLDRGAYSYAIEKIRSLSDTSGTNIRVLCNSYQLDYKEMLTNILKTCQKLKLTDTQIYRNAATLFNN